MSKGEAIRGSGTISKVSGWVAMLLMGSLASVGWPYSGGGGSGQDPYQLATVEDFLALAVSGQDRDKYFI